MVKAITEDPVGLVPVDSTDPVATAGGDETLAEFLGTNTHHQTTPDYSTGDSWVPDVRNVFNGIGTGRPDGWTPERDAARQAEILSKKPRTRRTPPRESA